MTAPAPKWERSVEALLGVVASVILLAMMLLTFVDVVARRITNKVQVRALHDRSAAFLQRCEPAWPVTTLGL